MQLGRRQFLFLGARALTVIVIGGSTERSLAVPTLGWPGGKRGAVSLTYDDGLPSHLDYAMPQLEACGFRGTFFVTGNAIPARDSDWRSAAGRGHEIADHTIDHPCDLRLFKPRQFLRREIVPMETYLDEVAGASRFRAYAYPCDMTNLGAGSPNAQAHRYAALLRRAGITAARTSEGEPNDPMLCRRSPYRLRSLAMGYDAQDLPAVEAYLQRAIVRGHWAILVFHKLAETLGDKGETLVSTHQAILSAIGESDLWCAPLGHVMGHIEKNAI